MSSRPPDKASPGSPPVDMKFLRQRLSLLHWTRVGLGGLSGLIAGVLGFLSTTTTLAGTNAYYGFYVAAIVYIISYYLARYMIVKDIPQKDRNKLFTQGIGSFIMMFLFVWILYNTNCYLGGPCFVI
jgi:uncharacterized membrane protein